MRIYSSFRTRLVMTVAALLTLLTLALVVGFVRGLDALAERSFEQRGLATAALLASATEAAVDFGDADNASTQLQNLAVMPEVEGAFLFDAGGGLLAAWTRHAAPTPSLTLPEGISRTDSQVTTRMEVRTRAQRTASLFITFSTSKLESERRARLTRAAEVAILVILIGVIFAFVSGTVLVRPLRNVTDVANRIAGGDFEAHSALSLDRTDEMGVLAAALKRMLERVRASHDALEHRVSERTRELAERLSQLRQTQEQLIVADRRSSVGSMAAGVAHEINNPLAYIMTNLHYVTEQLQQVKGLDPEIFAALGETMQGCERVRYIVSGLKTFSRGDEDKREPVDVKRALEAAISMAENEIRHHARLVRNYEAVPNVLGSEVRLAQVFLNLLMNAAQAIPAGTADRNTITLALQPKDGRVVISITDTGSGMSDEHRRRLFTPFFTTKPVGEGTGLGLSICQGIVMALGGTIEVETELGRGSRFVISLPASQVAETVVTAALPKPRTPRSRILVIDDDPLVGRSLARRLGEVHEVSIVTDGREALRQCAQASYDLILCDLMMPEMTGMDVALELEQRRPDLDSAMIFMTGGTFSPELTAFCEANAHRCLQKPIDFDALSALLEKRAKPRLVAVGGVSRR